MNWTQAVYLLLAALCALLAYLAARRRGKSELRRSHKALRTEMEKQRRNQEQAMEALSEAHRQELQEHQRRQREELMQLEYRIHALMNAQPPSAPQPAEEIVTDYREFISDPREASAQLSRYRPDFTPKEKGSREKQ